LKVQTVYTQNIFFEHKDRKPFVLITHICLI